MDEVVAKQLRSECALMLRYLMANGRRVPPNIVTKVAAKDTADASDLRSLTRIHDELAELAAPATPRSLIGLEEERTRKSFLKFLGPVRLARQLALFAFFLLAVVTTIEIREGGEHEGLLYFTEVTMDWVHLVILAVLAGLGATFAAMFRLHRELAKSSYDPDTESTYWSQIVLGVVAGLLLAEFITNADTHQVSRPLLALLGGFSGVLVNTILNRLVESVEQLFGGSREKAVDDMEEQTRRRCSEAVTQARLQIAIELFQIQRQLDTGVPHAVVGHSIAGLLDSLLPLDAGSGDAKDLLYGPSQPTSTSTTDGSAPVASQ